jgi:ABC-type bacteriocin/lantibiotic exporter with double-glycine peptidase domain
VIFLLLNISCSLLELIGIGAVIPFILLLTNPDAVHSNRYMKMLYDWVAPESFRSFVMTIAIIFIVFFILKNLYMMLVFVLQQIFIKRKYVEMTDCLLTSYLLKPYAYFFNHSSSELLRNIQVVDVVNSGMLTPMLNIAAELITMAILAAFVLYINPQHALLLGLGMGGAYLPD